MLNRSLDLFQIKFTGLATGIHKYSYQLDDTFFQKFDFSEVYNTQFAVELELDKRENMLVLNYSVKGTGSCPCDRCGDDYTLEVDTDDKLIVKLSGDDLDEDGIITLPPEEFEIDVSQAFYETIVVNFPLRRTHNKKDCNPAVIKKLEELEREVEDNSEDIDPRWSQLNNLK